MVSPISIPGFLSVHTRRSTATCDAALEARLASLEACLAALPSLITAAIDQAFADSLTQFRRDMFFRGTREGISAPLTGAHHGSPAIDPIQLPPSPICAEGAQSQLNPSVVQASPLISSSPLLRALATSVVKPHSKDFVAATVLLPESKTGLHASSMTSAPWLLHEHSFSDTTKNGPEVVLNLSIISATSEAIFPSLLTDNYSAFQNDKYGWINWYLVGKFVKKILFALHLFDELPKRWRENNMAITELMKERFSNKYFPSDPFNNHSIPQTILLLQKLCQTNRGEQGRVAANTYCQLLLSQSDNNVKLIVLDRLTELKSSHREAVADMFMNVLRALSSHNLDIRRKTLDIVLSLVTCTNINELVLILEREVVKTHTRELEKNGEYRQMLIQAIHSCAIKFPEVASTVVHLLMDFLGEEESNDSSQKVQQVNSMTVSFKRPTILADGTYATHHASSGIAFSPPTLFQGSVASGNLRSLLLTGDFFLGTVVAYPMTKLTLRSEGVQPSKVEVNTAFSQALLIVVSMLQLGQSPVLPHPIDSDSYAGMVLCIRLLCNTGDEVRKIWLKFCCQRFVDMLSKKQLRETEEIKATAHISQAQPVRLLLHGAISGALYGGHIHSLLQRECIFLRGLSWLPRFIDKWIHSIDLENHKLNPRIEHYGCIVDLLSHANLLNVAEKFIRDMPTQPDVVMWGSLLFTCRIYGNIELAELVDKRTEVFEPQGAYVNSPRDARSPLIWDVGHGHQDAVEVLLQNNANLVAENNDSITPLESSVLVGSLPCLELLVHIDHPNMLITPWEVALILGQWVSDIKRDTKMPVYCALIKLLQDNDLSVRLAACRSLYLHSEDASFSEREFINLLPIYWNSCLKLIKEVQELDSKKAWEESANECLLQIQLLVALRTAANWEDFHNSIFKP